jgi:hypothetical protein
LVIKEIFGYILGSLAILTDVAVDGLVEDGFLKTIKVGAQIEQGDLEDIVNKCIKTTEITLTDQNFFILYKKGFRSKQQKLIVLPLKYARDARTQGIIGKEVVVTFEVPRKEKTETISFNFALGVQNPQVWVNTIKYAIAATSLTTLEEKALGTIEIAKRGKYGLYFTQKRVIVAKSHLSFKWLALIIPAIIVGVFLLFAMPIAFLAGYRGSDISIYIGIGLTLTFVPYLQFQSSMRRISKKLSKLGPEEILRDDKKNFEIPYNDITRVELKHGRSNKIKISTKSENYDFGIMNKELFNYQKLLVRLVLPENKLIVPN